MFASSCPPLLGVDNNLPTYGAVCPAHNLQVKDYLLANPEIKTVILAGIWSYYFREDGPLTAQEGNPPARGATAASEALNTTLSWLHDENRQVILIGPVPTYSKSVPLALALEQAGMHKFVRSSLVGEQKKTPCLLSLLKRRSKMVHRSASLTRLNGCAMRSVPS